MYTDSCTYRIIFYVFHSVLMTANLVLGFVNIKMKIMWVIKIYFCVSWYPAIENKQHVATISVIKMGAISLLWGGTGLRLVLGDLGLLGNLGASVP